MKAMHKQIGKWGEGRLIAAALCLLLVLCVLAFVNRLPQKTSVQPVHFVATDLYDFVLTDINAATAGELSDLPGIGPVLAGRIVDDRTQNGPYRSVDELLRVDGIGAATLDALRPHIKVG